MSLLKLNLKIGSGGMKVDSIDLRVNFSDWVFRGGTTTQLWVGKCGRL